MTLQRNVSPLPPGRYWINVLGVDNMRDFQEWVRDMQGGVQIETVSLDADAEPPVEFVIFQVPEGRSPFLNAHLFGYPNLAPANVRSAQDVETLTSAEIPTPSQQLEDLLSSAGSGLSSFFGDAKTVLLLLLAAWGLSKR